MHEDLHCLMVVVAAVLYNPAHFLTYAFQSSTYAFHSATYALHSSTYVFHSTVYVTCSSLALQCIAVCWRSIARSPKYNDKNLNVMYLNNPLYMYLSPRHHGCKILQPATRSSSPSWHNAPLGSGGVETTTRTLEQRIADYMREFRGECRLS
ncbi:hypothetical protein JAAARDRAFT_258532 [Jaapia argillacea MUCL 33604]|uniref:Uncharacterized protein n=1 Tax=Jaapia argillacea MUCL 33604 TaxID=933084 RepID=A0A067PTK0_9AGAM|nr:hypothetical protein JAAARDRAFT_258532 [Jaapia argillacea MUCL 33604]